MTTTSHPWKQVLEHQAKSLRELTTIQHPTGATHVRIEEAVVLGCYAIRRLINASLLPANLQNRRLDLTAFPRRRHTIPLLGDEPLDVRYDLGSGRTVRHDPIFLCHQVLQNCIMEPWVAPGHKLVGIYVTSDHQRKIALYGVALDTLTELFRSVGGEM